MDFSQNKLSRAEWETIEIPVGTKEKQILELIVQGFNDTNIHTNENQSLFSFVKIEKTAATELMLFKKYFESTLVGILTSYAKGSPLFAKITEKQLVSYYGDTTGGKKGDALKKADTIRLQQLDATIVLNKPVIFEFLLIDLCGDLLKHISKQKVKYAFYLYTLLQIKKASIDNINTHLLAVVDDIIAFAVGFTKTNEIINNAYHFIEKNAYLLKYADRSLFSHQKELFSICKQHSTIPKLIMYTAPTSTGKTVSPLGLSEQSRIIFVCAARHIGLALAKSAISIEKKVAFAFGCETASDIRLHYFAALNYTTNRRSGGIGKVDNSVGTNVEIMICDVHSYLTAMHYMLAFNEPHNIILYWDEPTITLDYADHPLHPVIHRNWNENKIPTVVFSCATLPSDEDIQPVFADFRCKFDGAEVFTITSFDCRKSIPIIDKAGYCVLPHYLYADFDEMQRCVRYCVENKTLLRYFDLREIVRFVEYIGDNGLIQEDYGLDAYFEEKIQNITMNTLKEYYLEVLMHIDERDWPKIYTAMMQTRTSKYAQANSTSKPIQKTRSLDQAYSGGAAGQALQKTKSLDAASSHGILLTTKDAYTLTDGPTIFLAEDVNKIGTFYIQQSNIVSTVFQKLLSNITNNGKLIGRIEALDSIIRAKENKSSSDNDTKTGKEKASRDACLDKDSEQMMAEINKLRAEIRSVSLDPMYVPNSRQHQQIWTPTNEVYDNAFCCCVGEDVSKEIMLLNIENHLKVLLLLGIGLFADNANPKYMEIMKKLAEDQQLFMIIASSDYVYGTNYQFCHGFIGKDLTNMTQQKTLQAMGRIGRSNIQQDYTVRFRDDAMIQQLFKKPATNLEATNMCALFATDV